MFVSVEYFLDQSHPGDGWISTEHCAVVTGPGQDEVTGAGAGTDGQWPLWGVEQLVTPGTSH